MFRGDSDWTMFELEGFEETLIESTWGICYSFSGSNSYSWAM